ncbi:MAG TPA: extracellular solute-binding protein [Solirubrobacteraceae bacterium]|nr:extracellular solute-binding protein [Solirubrobacteraceae bacterium]
MMLKLRRITVTSLICAALLAAFAAAMATARPAATPRATVTLRFATTAQQTRVWQVMIASFQKANPDIDVQARFLPGNYGTALQTQLKAGNVPDVFFTSPGNGNGFATIPLARAGFLMDLAGQPWVKRLQPAALPLVTRNKHKNVYAWPMDVQIGALWINEPGFKALGLKAPEKFSDLLTLCKKITKAGKTPMAEVGIPVSVASALGTALAGRSNAATPRWQAQRKTGKVKFATSKEWQRTFQSIIDMKNAGCFSPGVAGASTPAVAAQLATGQALMYAGAGQILSLVNPLIKEPSKVSFIGVPMPGDKAGQTNVVITPFDALSVWKDTKVKDAALKFVNFMAQSPQVTAFARQSGNVNSLNATKGKLPATMKALEPYFKSGKTQLNASLLWGNPATSDMLGTGVVGMFTGQQTVASALKALDTTYDAK